MKHMITITAVSLSVLTAGVSSGAEKQKPYPHYWMSVATSSQTLPGMSEEINGIAAMFGGKNLFGPRRELRLQLESPRIPATAAKAEHAIPPGQKMGVSLPLVTPVTEKNNYVPTSQEETPEKFEKPKARMLIYWGCGDTIRQGQPKVLDTATMNLAEFGTAFSGRTPTRQSPPAPHAGATYAEWPSAEQRLDIPPDSSLVGKHFISGNYIPSFSFTLDAQRDYMAPVEFLQQQKSAEGAIKLEWKKIPTAIGYFATAIGHNEETGETIFWSASEVQDPGFALLDYLSPTDVARFIKDKVVIPPTTTTCSVPPVFKQGQVGMLQFIAYGEELNLSHPPKPKDPKKRWDIEWAAKVRLKSTAMMPLMADEKGGQAPSGKIGRTKKKEVRQESITDEPDMKNDTPAAADSDSINPTREIGNKLRGLFGF